jgi:hypothetical protein
VLRGLIEVQRFFDDPALFAAARRTADGILTAIRSDGGLPGRVSSDWSPAASSSCLTGNVQIAHSLIILYNETGYVPYRDEAYELNRVVRRTLRMADPDETRGAVRGSFPIDGDYGKFEYQNWATKFAIDSYTAEADLRARELAIEGKPGGVNTGDLISA